MFCWSLVFGPLVVSALLEGLFVLSLFSGPLVVSAVLDWLFARWWRWWRWWFLPLFVGLTGFGLFTFWVLTSDAGETNESLGFAYLIVAPFSILFPGAAAAAGVGLRRLAMPQAQ